MRAVQAEMWDVPILTNSTLRNGRCTVAAMPNYRIRSLWLGAVLAVWAAGPLLAERDALTATIDSFMARIASDMTPQQLVALDAPQAIARMTGDEIAQLATGYQSFVVDQPVIVRVAFHEHPTGPVFWLPQLGFESTDDFVEIARLRWRLWERRYPAGQVRLGVPALYPFVPTYFTFVSPADAQSGPVAVTELSHDWMAAQPVAPGFSVFTDVNFPLPEVMPPRLAGATLISNSWANRRGYHLVGKYRSTVHPAGPLPDQVVLTWSGDPRTSQTLQWRTMAGDEHAVVEWWPRYAWLQLKGRPAPNRVAATSTLLSDRYVANDPAVRWHRATLDNLQPATDYIYRIVLPDGRATTPAGFRTAPSTGERFSFVFHGDVQEGVEQWGALLRLAHRQHPDAAFHLMIGDLVNRGVQREEWDVLFGVGSPVFSGKPLVPVIGNHECEGADGHPSLYLQYMGLPANGPDGVEAQRAYHFRYGDVMVVVLDSNLEPATQSAWLDATLATAPDLWKIVAFHHPAYGSDPRRRDSAARFEGWLQVIDRHGVHLVLQGHDHAYLRTHPLRGGELVADNTRGTVYVTSVAGTKMYQTASFDYTAHSLSDVMTWQVIEIDDQAGTLSFSAYDADARLRDTFVITK
jgi:acid phosphatase type 7